MIGGSKRMLQDGWTLTLCAGDAYVGPGDIPDSAERLTAIVPGTVAATLRALGRFDAANPTSLENIDAWYRLDLMESPGPAMLRFQGLATIAEVYLNDILLLSSDSMFETYEIPVTLTDRDRLAICFRAIAPHLAKSGSRARWRPKMMRTQGLRLLRTTALGFMPGWCPDVVAVGPWRPVSLLRAGMDRQDFAISATLGEDAVGVLKVSYAKDGPTGGITLVCDGREALFDDADGRHHAELRLPDVKPWWPQTHGEPALHDIIIKDGTSERVIARTGFRRIEVNRGEDGQDFAIRINGTPVFCRGAAWTTADIVALPGGRADYEPWLRLAAEAGMNMIRIPGITTYESAEFFKLCDELGLMVWQDVMLANFDYPASDEKLMIHVKTELVQLLARLQASPSLVVLCGGSEMFQQGAMMGLPERVWKGPLATEIQAKVCAEARPDAVYVENSPSGGALPFFPNSGVAHYYGVGAYCRPLGDARRANVRFASECLAFSNVPDTETLAQHLPVPPSHDPRWKARVPRDICTSWDFEDVRDHYLRDLYDLDPVRLRLEDPELYLAFSRAVTAEVMEMTFAEWRRPASGCHGAMVWTLQDLIPGPGWGVIDATGRPKSTWHALKRAFRPVQVVLSDEGTNGLDIHVINDEALARDVVLELACLREGNLPVASGGRALTIDAHAGVTIAATDLFDAFFDTTYAYRFGTPSHDVSVARLKDAASGEIIAEAFHFPLGRAQALHRAKIEASLVRSDDGGWMLQVQTNLLAQSVTISTEGYRPAENGFHLAPGSVKRIALVPIAQADTDAGGLPGGSITSLAGSHATRF